MNLNEFAGKKLFAKYGIPLPKSTLLDKSNYSSKDYFKELGVKELVLKAQIPTGKRGKGGGILFADADDFQQKAEQLLGSQVNNHQVDKILAEEKLDIDHEIYLAVTLDRSSKGLMLIFCEEGGMEIEELSEQHPDKIQTIILDDSDALQKLPQEIRPIAEKLVELAREEQALLAEINPLIKTTEGQLMAADSKIVIDDNSLPKDENTPDYSFVKLDGTIGVIGNGAGLVMSTLDALDHFGGEAANFLDVGGGGDKDRMFRAIDAVLVQEDVEGLLINIFGGITRCDQIAQGIVDYKQEKQIELPLVVRLVGTNEEEGHNILSEAGIEFATEMNQAVQKIVSLVKAA